MKNSDVKDGQSITTKINQETNQIYEEKQDKKEKMRQERQSKSGKGREEKRGNI